MAEEQPVEIQYGAPLLTSQEGKGIATPEEAATPPPPPPPPPPKPPSPSDLRFAAAGPSAPPLDFSHLYLRQPRHDAFTPRYTAADPNTLPSDRAGISHLYWRKPSTSRSGQSKRRSKPEVEKLANKLSDKPEESKAANRGSDKPEAGKSANSMPGKPEEEKTANKDADKPEADKSTNKLSGQPEEEKTADRGADKPEVDKSTNKLSGKSEVEKTADRDADKPEANKSANKRADKPEEEKTANRGSDKSDVDKFTNKLTGKPEDEKTADRHANKPGVDKSANKGPDKREEEKTANRGADKPEVDKSANRVPGKPEEEQTANKGSVKPEVDKSANKEAKKPDIDKNKIIEDSLQLGTATRTFAYEQKSNLAMMTFLLNRVFETMVMYQEYVCYLNRFLVNNDAIQLEWYSEICCFSPRFGDYSLVFEDKEDPIAQLCLGAPVPENQLLAFTREVGDNYHETGSLIHSLRALCTNIKTRLVRINDKIIDRRRIQCEMMEKQSTWFCLLEKAIEQLEALFNWSLNTSGNAELFGLD